MVFITPLNMVKFRMQRPEWGYTGTIDAIQTIARTEGPMAFWKGTLPSFCRNSVCMAGMLGGYRGVEDKLPDWVGSRRHLLAGMIGGLSGSLMSYPFEMWRAAQMHNRSSMRCSQRVQNASWPAGHLALPAWSSPRV